jgi:CheY-like chemotaxis protein
MLPRIFDIFSQAAPAIARSQGGLGIGLSLVRGLVELHGGTIEAHSDGPGTGTTLTVRLPIAKGTPTPADTNGHSEGAGKTIAGLKILVVDDNHDSADSLALVLKMMGASVMTAYDGEEALEVASPFGPDAVLLDIGMPRLNGYDTARTLRQRPGGKAILLIALTGWGQDEDRRRSVEAGFNHHMVKPIDPALLMTFLSSRAKLPA